MGTVIWKLRPSNVNTLSDKKLDISKVAVGTIFSGKYIPKILVEVLAVDVDKNELRVKCNSETGGRWFETWDLQNTIWGFERKDYHKC